jgi:hypothetical protein
MGLLTREAILAAVDLPREQVSVPEWGGDVLVQGLDGSGRDFWETSWFKARESGTIAPEHHRALLVSLTLIDAEGGRLFRAEDIAQLGRKSPAGLDRVYEVALRLSGLGRGAVEKAEANLASDPSDSSGSS